MSNYHYGAYTSTTPRVQSSGLMFDKNSAHLSSHHSKLHQRSATKSPEAPRRSPSKKAKKAPKVQIDTNLKGLLSPVDNKKIDFLSPTAKGLKKKTKVLKGNRKKSNSPNKDLLYSNLDNKKKSKHQIVENDYEPDFAIKGKSNSVMHQDLLNHQSYEAEFANWLSKRVQSSKQNTSKALAGQKVYNSELMSPKYIEERHNESANPQNIWPDTKKTQKSENLSHRQSLDMPNSVKAIKKSLQNQLSAFSGQNEVPYKKDLSLFTGNEKGKSIIKQKLSTPKESFTNVENVNKINHKVSPRTQDPYLVVPSPLATHNQNILDKKYSVDAHSLRNSYNFELQKDNRSHMRSSLDSAQNQYSNEQYLELPRTAKHDQRGNFYKESPSSSKMEGSSLKFEGHTANITNEEMELPARVQYGKHSDPNIFHDLNNYMNQIANGKIKRQSDGQIQGYPMVQIDGENFVLSTRSALDRHENRFNFHPNTEENEVQNIGQNVKRVHSSSQPSKEPLMNDQRNEDNKITDEIISELLKRNNTKDIKVNPNAKFLLLRKQVQEKRGKQNFKSADWNSPGRNDQQEFSNEEEESLSREFSPSQQRNSHKAKVMGKEQNSTNEQLTNILSKTKQVLATYKDKENTWQKEKKLLVAEIKHLRSVIENI